MHVIGLTVNDLSMYNLYIYIYIYIYIYTVYEHIIFNQNVKNQSSGKMSTLW